MYRDGAAASERPPQKRAAISSSVASAPATAARRTETSLAGRQMAAAVRRSWQKVIYRYRHMHHYHIRMYHPIKLTIETAALAPAPPVITNSTITREMALASARSAERELPASATAPRESEISTLITRPLPADTPTPKNTGGGAATAPARSHPLARTPVNNQAHHRM